METSIVKQPLKVLEIPLSKCTEEVIPHYQRRYDDQKVLIHKHVAEGNNKELVREIIPNERAIMQLKELMFELDSLKLQVEDRDIVKFDAKTLSLRRSIVTLIKGYQDLVRLCEAVLKCNDETIQESSNPFEGALQIQIRENLEDLKLREYQEKCASVEALHEGVNDMHAIFGKLHEMVEVQENDVTYVSENVESTANNVNAGLEHLQVAHRLKTTAYPITAAILGGMLGGPIGMVAGAKVGGLAALCCAFAGYTGGKVFKNATHEIISETTMEGNEEQPAVVPEEQKTKI